MNFSNLAKLFSSNGIAKVAKGDWSSIENNATEFGLLQTSMTLAEFYEKAYHLLLKNYRNEYIVKNEIANKILIGRHSLNTATMLSEVCVGNNKADCVIINGESTCYEIKTELDSLARLNEQLETYTRVFDKTYIVATQKHLKALFKIYNEKPQFGIIELTKSNRLSLKIKAPQNVNFNKDLMFNVLRKKEYVAVAESEYGALPDIPNTQTYTFCKRIFTTLSPAKANELFKQNLKKHRKNDSGFIKHLPRSMINAGISYNLSRKYKNSILAKLQHTIENHKGDLNVLSIPQRQKT